MDSASPGRQSDTWRQCNCGLSPKQYQYFPMPNGAVLLNSATGIGVLPGNKTPTDEESRVAYNVLLSAYNNKSFRRRFSCTGRLVLTNTITATTTTNKQTIVKKKTHTQCKPNVNPTGINSDLLEPSARMTLYNCSTQYSAEQS